VPSWIHIEGALYGSIFPYLNEIRGENKKYDFLNSKVNSISVSTHKWLGNPIHTGVFIARKKLT